MKLSEKLIKLYNKFIDESVSITSFDVNGNSYKCSDSIGNTIIIDQEFESVEGISKKGSGSVLVIRFKDLVSNITKDEFNNIKSKCDIKINEFKELEKQEELKRQERLVDRLLDN